MPGPALLQLARDLHRVRRRARLQQSEAGLGVFDADGRDAEDFPEDDLADEPGADAAAEATGEGLAGAAEGAMDVEDGAAVVAGSEHSDG